MPNHPWLLVSAPADRASGASVKPVFDKPETQQEKHAEHADHSQQGMHEEENAEEERRPERIKQGRAGAGLGELTQHRKIAIGFRCPRPVGMGAFEARGER